MGFSLSLAVACVAWYSVTRSMGKSVFCEYLSLSPKYRKIPTIHTCNSVYVWACAHDVLGLGANQCPFAASTGNKAPCVEV